MMKLKQASIRGEEGGTQHLEGFIYGDTRGRFRDGEYVYTSRVIEALPSNIYRTLYSTYEVEFADIAERRAGAV